MKNKKRVKEVSKAVHGLNETTKKSLRRIIDNNDSKPGGFLMSRYRF